MGRYFSWYRQSYRETPLWIIALLVLIGSVVIGNLAAGDPSHSGPIELAGGAVVAMIAMVIVPIAWRLSHDRRKR